MRETQAGSRTKPPEAEPRRIQSIGVGFRIIRALEDANGPLPLKSIAAAVNMSASKAYLYIVTFEREGYVRQDPLTGHYGLGPAAIQLGLAAIRQTDVVRVSRSILERLRDATQCAAYISIWGNRGPVLAAKVDGLWQGSMIVRIGYVFPLLRSSTGRLFLAYLPPHETKFLIEDERGAARKTATVLPEHLELVDEIRRVGFSSSQNQINIGFASVSVPVFDHDRRIVATLTVLGPTTVMTEKAKKEALRHLREAAAYVGGEIGAAAPEMPAALPASGKSKVRKGKGDTKGLQIGLSGLSEI